MTGSETSPASSAAERHFTVWYCSCWKIRQRSPGVAGPRHRSLRVLHGPSCRSLSSGLSGFITKHTQGQGLFRVHTVHRCAFVTLAKKGEWGCTRRGRTIKRHHFSQEQQGAGLALWEKTHFKPTDRGRTQPHTHVHTHTNNPVNPLLNTVSKGWLYPLHLSAGLVDVTDLSPL